MIFFTSDHHFSHKNIITLCDCPFNSVEKMDEEMIRRWNETVKPEDTVYHLGDFSLSIRPVKSYVKRLNGKKHLVAGNHDKCHYFHFKNSVALLKAELEYLDGDWLLHGHVHNKWRVKDKMINVGVDVWDFYPVSLDKIVEIIRGENK